MGRLLFQVLVAIISDYHLRSRNINDNGHVVDWLGNKRLDLLMEHVLRDVLGVLEWIVRSEYTLAYCCQD